MKKLRYLNGVLIIAVLITGFSTATVSVANDCDDGYTLIIDSGPGGNYCERVHVDSDLGTQRETRLECLGFTNREVIYEEIYGSMYKEDILGLKGTMTESQRREDHDDLYNNVMNYIDGGSDYSTFHYSLPQVLQNDLAEPYDVPFDCL